jgi:uncharacterized protein (DUF433 family)
LAQNLLRSIVKGMQLSDVPPNLRDHFEQTPDVLRGKLRVRGSRVSVEQILELLEAGVAPSEIVQSFPSVPLTAVSAVERLAAHFTLTML